MEKNAKALVLFSGGLDSRLAIKLLQEKGNKVEAVFFKLPFEGGCGSDEVLLSEFAKSNNFKLNIVDCTKGKILEDYLEIIKNPEYGRGSGINPCIDCRIFLLEHSRQIAGKIKADFTATGEVLGERPMSQTAKALKIIDSKIPGVKRPLVEEGIRGRKRDKQIELARKYNISYPHPAGGCLLCEKDLASRFKFLLEKNLISEKTLALSKIGRHFFIDCWFVLGRNREENKIIEQYENSLVSGKGKPAVYFHKNNKNNKEKAFELQEAYSTGNSREKFEKYKL